MIDFGEAFEASLHNALNENEQNAKIVPERFTVLGKVFNDFREIVGKEPELKLHPAFASGGVSVEVPSIKLNQAEALNLKEVLSKCNTFEIVPLTNGNIFVSVTVSGVFEMEE